MLKEKTNFDNIEENKGEVPKMKQFLAASLTF
jgi:hypothetical protein